MLNGKRQQKAELALERTELLAEQAGDLPPYLKEQIDINRELSQVLNDQAAHMSDIGEMQRRRQPISRKRVRYSVPFRNRRSG